jgi:hypothetical protein
MEKALNGCNLAEPRNIGEKMQEASSIHGP